MGNTFGQKLVCCPLPTPTVNKLTWALQKIEGCFRSFMKTLKKRFQIFFSKFNSNLRKFLLYFRKFFGLKNNKNRHLGKRRHNFYSNFFSGKICTTKINETYELVYFPKNCISELYAFIVGKSISKYLPLDF